MLLTKERIEEESQFEKHFIIDTTLVDGDGQKISISLRYGKIATISSSSLAKARYYTDLYNDEVKELLIVRRILSSGILKFEEINGKWYEVFNDIRKNKILLCIEN